MNVHPATFLNRLAVCRRSLCCLGLFLLAMVPVRALFSGQSGFSQAFLADYSAASEESRKTGSLEPYEALMEKYTAEGEQAELEMTLAMAYNQWSDHVDPALAVEHFDVAMRCSLLPDQTRIRIYLLRGNSQEQQKHYVKALKDYLRGLLACTYYDTSRRWPEIMPPTQTLFTNTQDPEDWQRIDDYNEYRLRLERQRFVLIQRYYLVDAVKRVQPMVKADDAKLVAWMEEVTPDTNRYDTVMEWLQAENPRPWP